MPDVAQVLRRLIGWKVGEKLRASVGKGFLSEGDLYLFRLLAEITPRYRRTNFVLSAEEATHISPVFAQQGPGFVFRVALEMDEKAPLLLLDEAVDPSLRRPGENRISAVREILLLHLVPPGVRYSEGPRHILHQRMMSRLCLSEDTEAFGGQLMARNAVQVQDGPMDGQTGKHRRHGILPGPVGDLGEGGPIWLFRQTGGSRLGTGHDHSIQAPVQQIVDAAVVSTHVITPPFRTGGRLHRIKMQPDEKSSGRSIEQVEQLALGRHQGRIRHVVDEPDVEAVHPFSR